MNPFEIWEHPQTKVRFYFSHSTVELTTGVMMIPANTELPKHNRPLAVENLVQVSGKCKIVVFDDSDNTVENILSPGEYLRIDKGQYHIHANPFSEVSFTLFKADGDITAVINNLRQNFLRIELESL